jgi:fructoselysine-6-P-deglycase FrlB-like protein
LLLIVWPDIHAEVSITAEEIRTQPDLWLRAAALAREHEDALPAAGARVAVIGCGTSLFVAQAYAALRERTGLGETDAFAASEVPPGRRYDVVVAISRSGTTTEVVHALRAGGLADRSLALVAVAGTPVDAVADAAIVLDFADERSVVQTRFATSALTLLRESVDDGAAAVAAADAARALAGPLPVEPADIDQWTFLGRGWTVGLAREAALKLREAAQAWTEAYPLFEYRHGPISIAAPGRAIWSLSPLDDAVVAELGHTGATVLADGHDPLAALVLAQRCAVALAEARGLDPDRPRHLTRSVVLPDHDLEPLT